ncbi:MAG: hypothetical protein NXH72_14555 [Hyphomonadaceae bacterium]|nr:hypothetical protein [Hyphomonadaceae bacterium]
MIKTLTSLAAITAFGAIAQAQPLPAPPTAKYTPPVEANCDAQAFEIYFSKGDTALNAESLALLEAAKTELDGCIVGPVSLSANADDASSTERAEHLAIARLNAVSSALADRDLSGTQIKASFDPDRNATLNEPMGRKVQVRLSAWAPHIG